MGRAGGAALRAGGAVVSLGIIAAVGMWSWQLYTRDVGEIPIIRAELGPMRVLPDDPGGTVVPHQGRDVNRLVEGAPQTIAGEVSLAPPRQDLIDPAAAPADTPAAEPVAEADAPAETIPADAEAAREADDAITATVFAPPTMPAPRSRPSERSAPAARATRTAPPAAKAAEAAASEIARGTPMIQLGAHTSESIAVLQWADVTERHADLLTGKRRVIETTENGGQTLYRLRVVGFADRAETREACAELRARSQDCIPVTRR